MPDYGSIRCRVVIITIIGMAAYLSDVDLCNWTRHFMSAVALAADRSEGTQTPESDPFVDFKQGQAFANQEKYEQAIDAFNKAEQKGLMLYELFVFRGFAYHETNQLQKAKKDAEKAIALQPTRMLGYELLAGVHFAMGHSEDTITVASNGLAQVEGIEKAKLYKARGILLLKLGRREEAIRDLTRAAELGHVPAVLYHNRGRAYSELGRYELALRDYSEALTIDPSHDPSLRNRGWVYGCIGKFQMSIDDLNQLLARSPGDVVAHRMRGYVRLQLDDREGGLADLVYVLDHGSPEPSTFLDAAGAYYLNDNMPKAIELNEQGLAINDNDAKYELEFQRGFFLLINGQEKEAASFYKKAEAAAFTMPDPLELQQSIIDLREAKHDHPQIAKAADSILKELERTLAVTKAPHKPRPNQCQRLRKGNG